MRGRPTKGPVTRGQGLPQSGVGARNAMAGGLRPGGQQPSAIAVLPAPSLAVEAPKSLSFPHWSCLSLWGRSP